MTHTGPGEVSVEVAVEEAHDWHHRKNSVRWRTFSPSVLARAALDSTPRSVQDRSEFSSPVGDEPTVGTHAARESFAIGSDTDSIMEAADRWINPRAVTTVGQSRRLMMNLGHTRSCWWSLAVGGSDARWFRSVGFVGFA